MVKISDKSIGIILMIFSFFGLVLGFLVIVGLISKGMFGVAELLKTLNLYY